uniref:Uncharacterized protein n=1 Tax=Physcomitrium patens TaxID=3218 RepID=A0A7I4EV62_PHYPA
MFSLMNMPWTSSFELVLVCSYTMTSWNVWHVVSCFYFLIFRGCGMLGNCFWCRITIQCSCMIVKLYSSCCMEFILIFSLGFAEAFSHWHLFLPVNI